MFEYSEWPGRWGPPVIAVLQAGIILLVARTARNGDAFLALAEGAILLATLVLVSRVARRVGPTGFPLQRASSTNLVATRGNPRVWLVAHLDSKSQTVPMLPRIVSVVALSAVTVGGAAMLLAQLAGAEVIRGGWLIVSLLAGISALPSALCFVRNESPGAVDNASGVTAVLLAARALSPEQSAGVLITSAEELGVAGARATAVATGQSDTFINCDTLDDKGRVLCMYTGTAPRSVIRAAEAAATRLGIQLSVRRLIPGILADSVAFSDRGCNSITISRGTVATLARIHTRGDNSTATTGSGAAEVSGMLTALVRELT